VTTVRLDKLKGRLAALSQSARKASMTEITSRVATEHGSRYLQQLCKHFAHELPVQFDPERGTLEFPIGRVALRADASGLDLSLEPTSSAEAATLAGVVERHLVRFAFREDLDVVWYDAEGRVVTPPPVDPTAPHRVPSGKSDLSA
jgi:hypothetical protein